MRLRKLITGGEDNLLDRVAKAIGANSPERLKPEHLRHVKLTAAERAEVLKFQRGRGFPTDDKTDDKTANRLVREGLHELLTGPVYPEAEAARLRLGTRTPFDKAVLEGLIAAYGPDHLAGATVYYSGHATAAMQSLGPTLDAQGCGEIFVTYSDYSGDPGSASIKNTFLRSRQQAEPIVDQRFMVELENMKGDPVILINAGRYFGFDIAMSQKIRQRIIEGEIRFVMHNAADAKALKQLPPGAIIINLADSAAKMLEARVIGEQSAVHCGQAALRHLGVPLRDTVCIVKGAGLIGGSGIQGLLAFGYSPDRIIVVDPDIEARALAESILRAADPNTKPRVYAKTPPEVRDYEHGIALVATNGMGLTAEEIGDMPKHTVALTMTTGGGGIDIAGIMERLPEHEHLDLRFAAHGTTLSTDNIYEDLKLSNVKTVGKERGRTVTIVNAHHKNQERWGAFPPNLLDTVGQRSLVTSAMLNIAVTEAKHAKVDERQRAEARRDPYKKGDIRPRPLSDVGEKLLQDAFNAPSTGAIIRDQIPERLRLAVEGMDCGPRQRSAAV